MLKGNLKHENNSVSQRRIFCPLWRRPGSLLDIHLWPVLLDPGMDLWCPVLVCRHEPGQLDCLYHDHFRPDLSACLRCRYWRRIGRCGHRLDLQSRGWHDGRAQDQRGITLLAESFGRETNFLAWTGLET